MDVAEKNRGRRLGEEIGGGDWGRRLGEATERKRKRETQPMKSRH
jgi:hypothetical protein